MASMPQASANSGTPPSVHTVSTASSVPCFLHRSPSPAPGGTCGRVSCNGSKAEVLTCSSAEDDRGDESRSA